MTIWTVVVKRDGKLSEATYSATTMTELRDLIKADGATLHIVVGRKQQN
jgi:hypothetical protein